MFDVLLNLSCQLFRASKFHLSAQALHKLDGEFLTIEVSSKIKNMHFYTTLTFTKGRPDPDIGHLLIYFITDMSQRSIDAILGKGLLRFQLYIRRREA